MGLAGTARNSTERSVRNLSERSEDMGAWDEGMQGNDSALDAIGILRDEYESELKLKKDIDLITFFQDHCDSSQTDTFLDHWMVLGAVDYLIAQGYSLSNDETRIVRESIASEMTQIGEWTDPDRRAKALNRFLLVIEGKAEPEESKGLLEKLIETLSQ